MNWQPENQNITSEADMSFPHLLGFSICLAHVILAGQAHSELWRRHVAHQQESPPEILILHSPPTDEQAHFKGTNSSVVAFNVLAPPVGIRVPSVNKSQVFQGPDLRPPVALLYAGAFGRNKTLCISSLRRDDITGERKKSIEIR
ncbi:hypothetical protein FQN60_012029 [Etheostoma spectabile]|uniref:Uncharacterized protein n=1 Tax=Etheostoma spectabile TaxID=54343 RepID=A0A5J5DN50_9PERO|nr:hypothetical protein FQN60_012029 [Etheostoma spectabile]